jgi:hypothetical protein
MKRLLVAILMIAISTAANAEIIDGTWSSAEGCDRLNRMKTNPDAAWDGNFVEISYLSKKGILGYEWGCDFLDTHTNSYGVSVNVAACTAEGDSWPDLLLTKFDSSNGWVVAVTDEAGQISEEYYPVQCNQ